MGQRYQVFKPYRHRQWKAVCPVSGIVYYNTDFRRRWDGELVGPLVELDRHPQELLRVRAEQPLPWTRLRQDDQYVTGNELINNGDFDDGVDGWYFIDGIGRYVPLGYIAVGYFIYIFSVVNGVGTLYSGDNIPLTSVGQPKLLGPGKYRFAYDVITADAGEAGDTPAVQIIKQVDSSVIYNHEVTTTGSTSVIVEIEFDAWYDIKFVTPTKPVGSTPVFAFDNVSLKFTDYINTTLVGT